jgi:hypothetical protein
MNTYVGHKRLGWLVAGSGVVCIGSAIAGYLNLSPQVHNSNGIRFSLWYLVLATGLLSLFWGLLNRWASNPLTRGFLNWCFGWGVASLVFILASNLFVRRFLGHDWGMLPLYASFSPSPLAYKLFIPLALGGVIIGLIPCLLNTKLPPSWFLLLLMVLAYALTLAVAGLDGPLTRVMVKNFARRRVDYYSALPMVNQEFIFDYVHKMEQLPLHASTHPPLPVLFLWGLAWLGLSKTQCALTVAAFGSLTLIPLYKLARRLYGDEAARLASIVYVFVPSVVLYSATSLDVVFMFFCTLSLLYLIKSIQDSRNSDCIWWAVLFTICLGFTFGSFLFLGFSGLLILIQQFKFAPIDHLWRKLVVMGAGLLGLHVLLWIFLDYNILQVLVAAYRLNWAFPATHRSYLYWLVGNLAEYGIFLGLPLLAVISLYVGRQLSQLKKKLFPPNGCFFGHWGWLCLS